MKKIIFLCIAIGCLCISCASQKSLINKYSAFGLAYTVGEEYPVRIVTGDILDEKYAHVQAKIKNKWVHIKTKLDSEDDTLGHIVISPPDNRLEKTKIYSLSDFFKKEIKRVSK